MKSLFAIKVAILALTGIILSTCNMQPKIENQKFRFTDYFFFIHIAAMTNALTVCGEYIG